MGEMEMAIDKQEWITRAEKALESNSPGWSPSARYDYADSLYETYCTDDDGGFENDPEGAVDEDMTYWD